MRFLISIIFTSLFTLSNLSLIASDEALLVVNAENNGKLPWSFRTCRTPFKKKSDISRLGLNELNASGSAQFSYDSLQRLYKELNEPSPLYIIDLRQESHGFINGMAVGWFHQKNWGNITKPSEQIQLEEINSFQNILANKVANLHWSQKTDEVGTIYEAIYRRIPVVSVSTEEDLVQSQQMKYKRFFVTDFSRPSPQTVDDFVSFIKNTEPENPWYHFHCKAGRGRTTTFLILLDMMKNAKKASKKDIITRHYLIGGTNMERQDGIFPWRIECNEARRNFLFRFYEYCSQNKDNFQESWSQYCLRTNTEP